MTCRIGLETLKLKAGGAAVFWALTPHEVLGTHAATLLYRVTVPVPDFLQFQLPHAFTQHLMEGRVLVEDDQDSADLNRAQFKRWLSEFDDPCAENRNILLLDLEARLRRLARAAKLPADTDSHPTGEKLGSTGVDRAMVMGRFIAEHYTEPIHDADIARAAGLNPQYAMRLFLRAFRVGMHKHLNDFRVAHACRLLATTDQKVIDVALDSGFGSLSRFYESFSRACRQSPQEYRVAFLRRQSS